MIRVLLIFKALGCICLCLCGFVVIHRQDFPFRFITSPKLKLTPHQSFLRVSVSMWLKLLGCLGKLVQFSTGKLVSLAVSPAHRDSDRMEKSFILSLRLLTAILCLHNAKKSMSLFFIQNICHADMIRIRGTTSVWFCDSIRPLAADATDQFLY